jgi:hypothetical protein
LEAQGLRFKCDMHKYERLGKLPNYCHCFTILSKPLPELSHKKKLVSDTLARRANLPKCTCGLMCPFSLQASHRYTYLAKCRPRGFNYQEVWEMYLLAFQSRPHRKLHQRWSVCPGNVSIVLTTER